MPNDRFRLDRERTLLLVVDLQTRLAAAMPSEALDRVRRNVVLLLETARVLHLPVVATEQYPKGIGPTLEDVRAALPDGAAPLPKLAFSCWGEPAVAAAIARTGRDQVLAVGMETHVCVFQTVRDLLAAGRVVHVPADAVISRADENRRVGLELMAGAGAVATSTEAAVFDLLRAAGTPEFKALAPRLK